MDKYFTEKSLKIQNKNWKLNTTENLNVFKKGIEARKKQRTNTFEMHGLELQKYLFFQHKI